MRLVPIVYLPNEMYKTGKESAPNNVIFDLLFVITRKLFVDVCVMLVFGNATTIQFADEYAIGNVIACLFAVPAPHC